MNNVLHVTHVRPTASEQEVVALTTALLTLWPERQENRAIQTDQAWRFSRRTWKGQSHL